MDKALEPCVRGPFLIPFHDLDRGITDDAQIR
jgi:hypothetical protein